jgi:hypothetical protein
MTDPRTWLARTLPGPPAMAQMVVRAHHGGRLGLEALGRLRAAADPLGLEPRACGGGQRSCRPGTGHGFDDRRRGPCLRLVPAFLPRLHLFSALDRSGPDRL